MFSVGEEHRIEERSQCWEGPMCFKVERSSDGLKNTTIAGTIF